MSVVAIAAAAAIAALLWLCSRKPSRLTDRHAQELQQYQAEIDGLRQQRHAGLLSDSETQAQIIGVQRRMLRSRRDVSSTRPEIPQSASIAVIVLMMAAGLGLYLLQGNARLADHPAAALVTPPGAHTDYESARQQLLRQPGDIGAWLKMSGALIAMGDTQQATEALAKATEVMPDNADLWVARGETLVAHAGGTVTPAARLAFDRASRIDPKHPGPRLYLALSWMQAGKPDEALQVLEPLAKESPADAPWRPRVERMISGCKAMIAAGAANR